MKSVWIIHWQFVSLAQLWNIRIWRLRIPSTYHPSTIVPGPTGRARASFCCRCLLFWGLGLIVISRRTLIAPSQTPRSCRKLVQAPPPTLRHGTLSLSIWRCTTEYTLPMSPHLTARARFPSSQFPNLRSRSVYPRFSSSENPHNLSPPPST